MRKTTGKALLAVLFLLVATGTHGSYSEGIVVSSNTSFSTRIKGLRFWVAIPALPAFPICLLISLSG